MLPVHTPVVQLHVLTPIQTPPFKQLGLQTAKIQTTLYINKIVEKYKSNTYDIDILTHYMMMYNYMY